MWCRNQSVEMLGIRPNATLRYAKYQLDHKKYIEKKSRQRPSEVLKSCPGGGSSWIAYRMSRVARAQWTLVSTAPRLQEQGGRGHQSREIIDSTALACQMTAALIAISSWCSPEKASRHQSCSRPCWSHTADVPSCWAGAIEEWAPRSWKHCRTASRTSTAVKRAGYKTVLARAAGARSGQSTPTWTTPTPTRLR